MGLEPVERKVALITGANKGIGLEIARQLGRQGMTVLVGARDAGRLARLPADGTTGGFFDEDGPLPW
jgi:NAD(P)-dependent dehydrogenase (short-subunit alcohol dehydrogenase family)